jgi:hypothetical protein
MRAYFRVNIVVLICVVLFLFFTNALAQEGGNPQGWFDRPIPLAFLGVIVKISADCTAVEALWGR